MYQNTVVIRRIDTTEQPVSVCGGYGQVCAVFSFFRAEIKIGVPAVFVCDKGFDLPNEVIECRRSLDGQQKIGHIMIPPDV